MEFIKNLHFETMPLWKKMVLLGIVLVIFVIVLTTLKMVLTGSMGIGQGEFGPFRSGIPGISYDENYSLDSGGIEGPPPSYMGKSRINVSFLPPEMPVPVPPPYPEPGVTPGADAEEFEVTSYSASIKAAGESDGICATIIALKLRKDVVFESSNETKTGCTYTFKVENQKAGEILAIIKNLDPKSLSENTYTIKRAITGLTSEIDILTKKLASIESTLEQALAAYDEISRIATADKDAESLATIIDSKVNLIERLSMERINIQNQITTIQRAYSDQLDHVHFTVFTVSVYEQKVVDLEQIGDSWVEKLHSFAIGLNTTLQQITIGLISFLIELAYYALFFVIILYIAKHGWRMTKEFWRS